MQFSNNVSDYRLFFCTAWQKYLKKQTLTALEKQVVAVVLEHPEYHALLADPESACRADFSPEQGQMNPFLHLSLHLSVLEQVHTNRPAGIQAVYDKLCETRSAHTACHQMIDVLGETLWQASRDNQTPDESLYLESMRALISSATTATTSSKG